MTSQEQLLIRERAARRRVMQLVGVSVAIVALCLFLASQE